MHPVFDAVRRYLAQEWYRKLKYLFVAILLWQWFFSLEDYWWEETFQIVFVVLALSTAAEMLLAGRRWVRLLLQLLALIAINIHYTGYAWVPRSDEPWRESVAWRDWFSANLTQLEPFLWISLGVWLLYQFAALWTITRMQVLMLVSICLLTLLVADSFSPLLLWDNVAWTVFVGLAWLIAEHLWRFQSKHPESWKHLLQYPVSLIMPTLLVLALVMASGLFVPNIAPVFKDPYTAWKESRGETVPSFVGDKGLSGSPADNAGDSRSGYSRGDSELGDGFQFDYSPIMEITTTRRSYWRGETKGLYTGTGWEDGSAERRESSVIGLMNEEELQRLGGPGADVETIEVAQTVTMLREDALPVLFGAAPISRLMSLGDGEAQVRIPGRVAWLPYSWELRWPEEDERAAYPQVYSIVSEVPILDEEGLRAAAAELDSSQQRQTYLQLPDGLPQRVMDLAEEITAAAESDYERMRALEDYLKLTFPYTNTPDLSRRESDDFVDAFLFEVQEGYCDYYSSALAVMGRTIGVPTRWVKGYAPGVLPADPFMESMPDELELNPEGSGTYTVRNADAHSWVEAYFEGYGWIAFEPTAGFSFPYSYAEEEPEVSVEEVEPAAPVESAPETAPDRRTNWMPFVGAAMVALLAAWTVLRRRQLLASARNWRLRHYTANQRIVWEMERLLRDCRRKGLQYAEHETLREAIRRWGGERSYLLDDFQAVLQSFELAKYSGRLVTSEEAELAAARIKQLREKL
ncbi:transglutaminase domain-containing protein [Paenibacillus sp. IB182496]|uniref:Transglutaminase domain-containing protein n=1 Tax=Paenibacillus sabuli TaxID=2772509 RepID=A0A927BPT7_9BACL|nr:transglutaminase domain-containing protein [Paenibacillus sabuli]MBD2844498.1 transglutaminase domain-containing protein [Paenibacillus sabuli]